MRAFLLFTTANMSSLALSDDAVQRRWQVKRLFEPTPAQLQRETRGQVFIYHGLPDTVVDRAMTQEYDRLQSMMFTGVIITDDQGSPINDPETGTFLTVDDGCD
jgi:hypothetical protein